MDLSEQVAWLIEEVVRQTGASEEAVRACMSAPGHVSVLNRRADVRIRELVAAEKKIVELQMLLDKKKKK
jgi:hypothetical protein